MDHVFGLGVGSIGTSFDSKEQKFNCATSEEEDRGTPETENRKVG